MIALRNRRLQIAALLIGSGVVSALAAKACFAVVAYRSATPAGEPFSQALQAFGIAVTALGWIVVVGSFGDSIRWENLRRGAVAIVAGYWIVFLGIALYLVIRLVNPTIAPFRFAGAFDLVDDFLLALMATFVLVALWTAGGTAQARSLRRAAFLWAGARVALMGSTIFRQAFYSSFAIPRAMPAGLTLQAAGAAVLAVAGAAAALAFGHLGERREEGLALAGGIAVAAALLLALGEILFNAHTRLFHYPGLQVTGGWFAAGGYALEAAGFGVAAWAVYSVAEGGPAQE